MTTALSVPTSPRHVVAIIGGAVAGSEAAALCAERGVIALVFEQNDRPFGKIEDGLPRWHEKLRQKEYDRIGANLTKPGVVFVPSTALGVHVHLAELCHEMHVSAVLLANGAWRDRALPVEGADAFINAGLVYQNPLVYWYNHYPEEGYAGPRFDIQDGAIVIGGGLASIDVVKIINLELYKRALAARGIRATTVELEHDGIPKTLARHGLSAAALGVTGCALYYRREKEQMPLASADEGATEKQLAKLPAVRAKILDKVLEKYLVKFVPNRAPVGLIVEEGRLVGLKLQKTATVNGKLERLPEIEEARGSMIVSSIGSIPQPVPGLPMKGELLDWADWTTGALSGFDNVFGLGNVLTGKGNIKDSRKNAQEISAQVAASYLGVGGDPADIDVGHAAAREAAEPAVSAAQKRAPLAPEAIAHVFHHVRQHWDRVGYGGDYAAWIDRVMPRGAE